MSCCCECRHPRHSHDDYGERCLRCGRHRAPGGKVVWEDGKEPPLEVRATDYQSWLDRLELDPRPKPDTIWRAYEVWAEVHGYKANNAWHHESVAKLASAMEKYQ